PRSDRAADAAPVAGDAPPVDSRQCGLALRAGRGISRGSVDCGRRVWSSWRKHSPTRRGRGDRSGGDRTHDDDGRVPGQGSRRDRHGVAQETWVRDEAGRLVARSIHHQSFLAEQSSGEVTLRDPASKEGAKQGGEPSGDPLSVELRKTFTDAMCDEFFFRSRNY